MGDPVEPRATRRVIALIPAYNEALHVGEVVAGVLSHLPVLVVDDGSTDGTAQVAREAGAEVLRQQPNQGKGAALKAGFQRLIEEGVDAAIMLDADGQHDPAEIPLFLQAYEQEGYDLIIGAREYRHIPPLRRTTNTIGRVIFSWALGQYVPDNQSGYRLVSRRLMQAMLASAEQGFQFEVEMIVVCVQQGYRLGWVPIRTIYAGERSHIRPAQHVVEFFRIVFWTRRVMREKGKRDKG